MMYQQRHTLFEYTDNFKPGAFELPTTTHSSPGSLKSKSLKFDDSPFNCSFDEGNQSTHALAIWDASIKYLQAAVKQFVDMTKGLNDESLHGLVDGSEKLEEENLEEIILRNHGLKIQQKHEFINDLQNEPELMDLIRELSKLFTQNIFHEITYAVFKIWEKKKENQNRQNQKMSEDEPFIPHFNCFWGFQDEEPTKVSDSIFFNKKTMEDVVQSADKCAEEIGQELYFDNKLSLINLRQCQKESHEEEKVASFFGEFFKTLARSVFLSSEGFFTQPNNDDENMCEEFNSEFDFEMNEMSALDQLQLNQNRFVRSFSQVLEDDDEDFEFSSSGLKKRKLQ